MTDIHVGIGDYKIVANTSDTLRTFLGSCIGICFYSPEKKVGCILHIMLPKAPENVDTVKKAKYADTGIDIVLRKLKDLHDLTPASLKVSIFGGASVLDNVTQEIGLNNANSVKTILKSKGLRIINQKVGGDKGYKIHLDLATGKIGCQIFGAREEIF